METFSALLAFCTGNSPVPGEFPVQRPMTRSFEVFFDLRPNKRLSKQSWGWWSETPSSSLWRHRNGEFVQRAKLQFEPEMYHSSMNFRCHIHWACFSIEHYIRGKLKWLQNYTLQWRHNDHNSVTNHQPHGCLLNRLFGGRSKKTSKLRVTGLCAGNSPGPVNSSHKGPVTRKMLPFDDVIMYAGIFGGIFRHLSGPQSPIPHNHTVKQEQHIHQKVHKQHLFVNSALWPFQEGQT